MLCGKLYINKIYLWFHTYKRAVIAYLNRRLEHIISFRTICKLLTVVKTLFWFLGWTPAAEIAKKALVRFCTPAKRGNVCLFLTLDQVMRLSQSCQIHFVYCILDPILKLTTTAVKELIKFYVHEFLQTINKVSNIFS